MPEDFRVGFGATITCYTQLLTLDLEPDELRILHGRLHLLIARECLNGIFFVLSCHFKVEWGSLVLQVDLATDGDIVDQL